MSEVKRRPVEWEEIDGIVVLDPDGWDRSGAFQEDWNTPLTREEWEQKMHRSTIMSWPPDEKDSSM